MELITTDKFEEYVADSSLPVLLDFFAEWCSPCKVLEDVLESVESEFEGRVVFYKVNVDSNMDLAKRFEVSALPTLLLFNSGEVVGKKVGMVSESELKSFIDIELRK